MAYSTIPSASLAVGKPTKKELFDLIRSNFEDHESRIVSTEAAAAAAIPFEFEVFGKYNDLTVPYTGVMYYRVPFACTLTGAVILIFNDGLTGTLEIDIQKKSGVGAFATVFSTKPSVAAAGGDFSVSSNATFSTTTLLANDILRLDITSKMAGKDVDGFVLRLTYST